MTELIADIITIIMILGMSLILFLKWKNRATKIAPNKSKKWTITVFSNSYTLINFDLIPQVLFVLVIAFTNSELFLLKMLSILVFLLSFYFIKIERA